MADIERKEQEIPKYVKVREVMQLCEVSESRAYRIMQQLNKELEAQGFVTTSGRVSRKYLMTHIMAECNYSREGIQRSVEAGYIPIERVPRLMKSHMSLEHLLDMLRANDLRRLQQIYLLHLSTDNSEEQRFREEVQKQTGAEVYVC